MPALAMPIKPVHDDGTHCIHQVNQRTGKPKDPAAGCPGRTGYAATCPEYGDVLTQYLRLLVADMVTAHRRQHPA